MANIDEISQLMFNGSTTKETSEDTQPTAQIIYGTALADSADGVVLIQIDDEVYDDDDEMDEEEYVDVVLEDEDDSVDAIDEDDEDEDDEEDDDDELVYWDSDDDDAVEEDN